LPVENDFTKSIFTTTAASQHVTIYKPANINIMRKAGLQE